MLSASALEAQVRARKIAGERRDPREISTIPPQCIDYERRRCRPRPGADEILASRFRRRGLRGSDAGRVRGEERFPAQ